MKSRLKTLSGTLNTTVVVSALGYFVDIYDLILFSLVRVKSLTDLGVPAEQMLDEGVRLLNAQMWGMLLGGVLWGVLGDKRGRLSVLFGSIVLYSVANLLNAWVIDVQTYALLRFVAGIGLAGELGAAITLVAEVLPRQTRGLGTMVVSTVGVTGAVAGGWIAESIHWRSAYVLGGVMGLMLLVLRVRMFESGMYEFAKKKKIRRGDFWLLIGDAKRFKKYLACIVMGIPTWFVIGILLTFAPELAVATAVKGPVVSSQSIFYGYIGFTVGDFLSGLLSQKWRSRRKTTWLFLVLIWLATLAYLLANGLSVGAFYGLCFAAGLGGGYWAVFMTNAAEQFGTNLRATVTTTVPNWVRGSTVLMTGLFQWARHQFGIVHGTLWVGTATLLLAAVAVGYLEESFSKDLDYLE